MLQCFLRRHFSSGTDVDLNIIEVDGKFVFTESTNDKEADFGYSIGCSTWQTVHIRYT